jgi:hypothetical protein
MDVEAADQDAMDEALREALATQLNELNWILRVGDIIRIEGDEE